MASKNDGSFSINGIRVNAKQLGDEMRAAVDAAAVDAAEAVKTELEDLLTRLNRRSTKRGVGMFASRYDSPLRNAKVVIKYSSEQKRVKASVYVDMPGTNVFDILDAGSPPKSAHAGKVMLFPYYTGRLTSTGKFSLSRSRVGTNSKTVWVHTRHVAGFEGRHYYQQVVDKVFKEFGGRKPSVAKGRFVYDLDPDLIRLNVRKT